MEGLNPDIALLPVSGTYVMTADEIARATNEIIKPGKVAIPMHWWHYSRFKGRCG